MPRGKRIATANRPFPTNRIPFEVAKYVWKLKRSGTPDKDIHDACVDRWGRAPGRKTILRYGTMDESELPTDDFMPGTKEYIQSAYDYGVVPEESARGDSDIPPLLGEGQPDTSPPPLSVEDKKRAYAVWFADPGIKISKKEWCKRHGLSYGTVRGWEKQSWFADFVKEFAGPAIEKTRDEVIAQAEKRYFVAFIESIFKNAINGSSQFAKLVLENLLHMPRHEVILHEAEITKEAEEAREIARNFLLRIQEKKDISEE